MTHHFVKHHLLFQPFQPAHMNTGKNAPPGHILSTDFFTYRIITNICTLLNRRVTPILQERLIIIQSNHMSLLSRFLVLNHLITMTEICLFLY